MSARAKEPGVPLADSGGDIGQRRAARLAAVQALYQIDVNGNEVEDAILEFLSHRAGVMLEGGETVAMSADFFSDLVRGAVRRMPEADRLIERSLSQGWRLARLETVLRAILRCAVYELIMRRDVPPKVTINEYVEVTHAFFSGEQPAFANAVLDRIARVLRPDEIKDRQHDRTVETG